jgi:hypothetical protein
MTLYRCVAAGVYASGRRWSIRQYFVSSAVLATVETDWLAQIASLWTDGSHGLQTLYPTTTVLNETTTYQLSPTLLATALVQDQPSHPGTSANDGLPDQNSILVSQRTAGVGQNNRGRTFLPAPDETIVVGDLLGSTPATRVSTAMSALRTGMGASGHIYVLLNTKVTKRDPVIGTTKTVTHCQTDRVIRSQRRRIEGDPAVYV